jgi:hypothetical protein
VWGKKKHWLIQGTSTIISQLLPQSNICYFIKTQAKRKRLNSNTTDIEKYIYKIIKIIIVQIALKI